jgi:RES domain-containing protein
LTLTAWRIVQTAFVTDAFSGEGARLYSGRWNHRGERMVYTAGALSLAALELLVHLEVPKRLAAYLQIPIQFEDTLCRTLDRNSLPPDWMESPAPGSTKDIGSEWLQSAISAVLAVPSVIVPNESLFLLNPQHLDFPTIHIGVPVPFQFDPRLLKSK